MRSRYGPDPTFVVPSFMDRPNPLPPHVPYVQPPFLGGDYDLNPAGISQYIECIVGVLMFCFCVCKRKLYLYFVVYCYIILSLTGSLIIN